MAAANLLQAQGDSGVTSLSQQESCPSGPMYQGAVWFCVSLGDVTRLAWLLGPASLRVSRVNLHSSNLD